MKKLIVNFKPISERICYLRLRGKYRKISIVNGHAPTEHKDIEIKDKFYGKIEDVLEEIPKYDIKIVLGDLNAKLGKEEIYQDITGGKSLHVESNENGKKLLEFAIENNMKIIITYFDKKDIHKVTWISPNFRVKNQIDHVLIEDKHCKAIRDCRSYRGAEADSEHTLVMTKLKQDLPEKRKIRRERQCYNVERLQDNEIAKKLEKEINAKLETQSSNNTIEGKWNEINTAMTNAANLWLGNTEIKRNTDWFDEDCEKVLEARNKAKI